LTVDDVVNIVKGTLNPGRGSPFFGNITIRVESGRPTLVEVNRQYKSVNEYDAVLRNSSAASGATGVTSIRT